jgi:hypothetical protein
METPHLNFHRVSFLWRCFIKFVTSKIIGGVKINIFPAPVYQSVEVNFHAFLTLVFTRNVWTSPCLNPVFPTQGYTEYRQEFLQDAEWKIAFYKPLRSSKPPAKYRRKFDPALGDTRVNSVSYKLSLLRFVYFVFNSEFTLRCVCSFLFIGSRPSTGKRKSPAYNFLCHVNFTWVEVPSTLFPVRNMKV